MDTLTVFDIANFFLSKDNLSQKKLQKLVYYAYAWFIALYNENPDEINAVLFEEEPEAWIHGPVFPSLYEKYKGYNWQEIPRGSFDKKISSDLEAFLEDIWDKFGGFSADSLEYMTHHEEPWINARKDRSVSDRSNEKLSKRDIFLYYNRLIPIE